MLLPSLPFLHSAFSSFRVSKWTQFFHISLFNYESPGKVRWIRGLSLTGLFFLLNEPSKPSLEGVARVFSQQRAAEAELAVFKAILRYIMWGQG